MLLTWLPILSETFDFLFNVFRVNDFECSQTRDGQAIIIMKKEVSNGTFAFLSVPWFALKLKFRQTAKFTDKIHSLERLYLPNDLYFCLSSSGIYIPLAHSTALSGMAGDLKCPCFS